MSEIHEGISIMCDGCGAPLRLIPGKKIIECEYCQKESVIPNVLTPELSDRYNKALELRRDGDFDRAIKLSEALILEYPDDAELYWTLVLCRYGVKFVEDINTHKTHPTLNRMQVTSILTDKDYLKAIENAGDEVREVYRNTAEQINKIQKKYQQIMANETPFDVFISYKETDLNGNRTKDSINAYELYKYLTQNGYKVFFSRVTLQNKVGQEYEPYIYAALNSAKVMILIGSKLEYINAQWVKNEWSRFLEMKKRDETKILIPAIKNMKGDDLPDELSIYQAKVMEPGFEQDLLEVIEKRLGKVKNEYEKKAKNEVIIKEKIVEKPVYNPETLMKKARMEIEEGHIDSARFTLLTITEMDPEYEDAYLLSLMLNMNLRNVEDIFNSDCVLQDFDGFSRYVKVSKDEDTVRKLIELNNNNINRLYHQEKEKIKKYLKRNNYKKAREVIWTISPGKVKDDILQEINTTEATFKKSNKKANIKIIIENILTYGLGIFVITVIFRNIEIRNEETFENCLVLMFFLMIINVIYVVREKKKCKSYIGIMRLITIIFCEMMLCSFSFGFASLFCTM